MLVEGPARRQQPRRYMVDGGLLYMISYRVRHNFLWLPQRDRERNEIVWLGVVCEDIRVDLTCTIFGAVQTREDRICFHQS
jgi:hypothetical protein